jgi:hypothetical protein
MDTLDAKRFMRVLESDPAWATRLKAPLEIAGNCNIRAGQISHLSPLLHFTDNHNWFVYCKELKVAEGTFNNFVQFDGCGIEEIGDLRVLNKSPEGLLCTLTGTPLAHRDPSKALEAMTGSPSIPYWEEVVTKLKTRGHRAASTNIGILVGMAKKQKLKRVLRNETTIEI